MISLQDERKELFQWDTNRYIILNDQIGDAAEIHFANGVFSRSIDVKIEDGKALIPDVLLQYARPLKVWVFVGEASNGYTKVEHVFKVNERNKPSDYVFTPTEQLSLQELIEKFEDFQDSIGSEVEEYLKENPVKVAEDDPTVPQWAKEEEKPKYTAEEVGARSKDWLPTAEEIGAQPKGNYALKSDIPQIPEAPVQSVNGKTGAVKLTAEDVGALPSDTQIPDPYTLPTASADTLGAVIVGDGLTVDANGLLKTEVQKEDVDKLSEEIDEIKENGAGGSDERLDKIASFFDLTEPVRSNNLLNPDTLVRGYYLTNTGTVSENSVYVYTDYIAVEEGDPVSVQKTESNYRSYYGIGFISAYDAAKNLLPDKGATSVTHYFTVPAGVSYLRLSFSMISPNNSGMTDWAIVKSAGIIPYEPYGIIGEEPHLKASAYTHIRNGYSVAVGNEWTANEENHDICGWNMVYKANIPTGLTGSVSVGKGYNGYQGGYITVTPTTVTFYKGEAPEASEAVSHGLTLKDYIYVGIAVDYSGGGKIRVATNGGKFDTEIDWASVRKGRFFVKDTNAETTDGRFAYTCHGWGAKTHMYGDSYFGVHNPGRWPYHLVQDGYTDVLINGFSGRNSADALRALKSVLEYSERPERIIWALGMNDPDADGAPNASWLACIKELMTICEDKAIELILTTTPLVEPVENTYKNEYVRNSRYRYIDFASAVGASSDTTWFDNMVYSDGVHPEVQGAAALYFQALADVPELMY